MTGSSNVLTSINFSDFPGLTVVDVVGTTFTSLFLNFLFLLKFPSSFNSFTKVSVEVSLLRLEMVRLSKSQIKISRHFASKIQYI